MEGVGDIRSGRLLSLYVLVQLCYNLTEDKTKKKAEKQIVLLVHLKIYCILISNWFINLVHHNYEANKILIALFIYIWPSSPLRYP